jgi:hypothetical protein
VAIPKYFDYAANAKISSTKGTLGGVRSAIANFYANSAVAGSRAYPTLTQLQTTGTVMQEPISANPFNNDATVAAASWAARRPSPAPTAGTTTPPSAASGQLSDQRRQHLVIFPASPAYGRGAISCLRTDREEFSCPPHPARAPSR